MKKVFFAGLLVFSLLINVSAGIVIAKHWWLKHDSRDKDMLSSCPALSSQDVKSISGDWYDARQSIMATRKELHTKRAEVLDLVAANPGDLLMLIGSGGALEIAERNGNAARRLGVKAGERVSLWSE